MPHDHEITGKRKKHEVRIPDVFFFCLTHTLVPLIRGTRILHAA